MKRGVVFAACVLALAGSARAETTLCSEITHLPFTIAAPGTWCFKRDLSTSMSSGNAITVNANSVVIDLNGFKLGGLGGGGSTQAVGISVDDRFNLEIRNGTIRGFLIGVSLAASSSTTGGGHLVQDLLVDGSKRTGISLWGGRGSMIRRNRIVNIGSSAGGDQSAGIRVDSSQDTTVEENFISSVSSSSFAVGIAVSSASRTRIYANAIHNISGPGPVGSGSQTAGVTVVFGNGTLVRRNDFMNADKGTAVSVTMPGSLKSSCLENTVNGYTVGLVNC